MGPAAEESMTPPSPHHLTLGLLSPGRPHTPRRHLPRLTLTLLLRPTSAPVLLWAISAQRPKRLLEILVHEPFLPKPSSGFSLALNQVLTFNRDL